MSHMKVFRKVTCASYFSNKESHFRNSESNLPKRLSQQRKSLAQSGKLFGKVTCESQKVICASRFPKWESDFGKLKKPNKLSRVKTMGRE